MLEGTRRPWLREEIERWDRAHLNLAELGLRAAGSPDPPGDAQLVVAAITGLLLGQIASPRPDFEDKVFRPALERLFRASSRSARPRAERRPRITSTLESAESPVEGWLCHA